MRSGRIVVALLVLLSATSLAQTSVEDARKKWPDLRYLEPSQLRELPDAVRADLEKLGCRIPRFMKWDARHNVIQGQFFKAGQNDWAVLCQVGPSGPHFATQSSNVRSPCLVTPALM